MWQSAVHGVTKSDTTDRLSTQACSETTCDPNRASCIKRRTGEVPRGQIRKGFVSFEEIRTYLLGIRKSLKGLRKNEITKFSLLTNRSDGGGDVSLGQVT